jgi:hypothetical protein
MSIVTDIIEDVGTIDNKTNTSIPLSTQLKGTYSLSNTVKTLAFDAITYTGNGTSQEIVTGLSTIDFTQASNGTGFYHDRVAGDCIVKNDAGTVVESGEIAFKDVAGVDGVCKVHIKSRGEAENNAIFDGLRGAGVRLFINTTGAEDPSLSTLSAFTSNGFSVGNSPTINKNLSTYIAYQTLYTHIKWGLTNQGKRYIEAYNPVTNDTMIMYQGSGVAGHEIPHSVGVELDFWNIKNLGTTTDWSAGRRAGYELHTNLTDEEAINTTVVTAKSDIALTVAGSNRLNWLGDSHILYGKAKSKTWTIVQYTGTGVAGNFVETKDVDGIARRPRRVIIKRIDSAESWYVWDSERGDINYLQLDTSATEGTVQVIGILSNGFKDVFGNSTANNAENGKYIALVEFDTDGTGTDGSYFDNPTDTTQLQLDDGLMSVSRGYTSNGADNIVVSKSGTITPTGGWL